MALNHGYIESGLLARARRFRPLMEYKWNIGLRHGAERGTRTPNSPCLSVTYRKYLQRRELARKIERELAEPEVAAVLAENPATE